MGETFAATKLWLARMSKAKLLRCCYCFKPIHEGDNVTRKGYSKLKEYAHASCYEANGYVKLKRE